MGTVIRPEVSQKNFYWIGKHRHYELSHFCRQYPLWKRALSQWVFLSSRPVDSDDIQTGTVDDHVAKCAENRAYYLDRIKMLEDVAAETDKVIGRYILEGITEGLAYDKLKARLDVPCCKDIYYDLYRRFFWLLDKARN